MKASNQPGLRLYHHMILAAITVTVAPAIVRAQPGFGRVANQSWGGEVVVMNRMTSKSASDILGGRNIPVGSVGAAASGRSAVAAAPRTVAHNLMPFIALAWQEARVRMIDTALVFLDERDVGGGAISIRGSSSTSTWTCSSTSS